MTLNQLFHGISAVLPESAKTSNPATKRFVYSLSLNGAVACLFLAGRYYSTSDKPCRSSWRNGKRRLRTTFQQMPKAISKSQHRQHRDTCVRDHEANATYLNGEEESGNGIRGSNFQVSLLDLARMKQWGALIKKCNKREAKRSDSDGLYPLHWACSGGAPVKVVEVLLNSYPRASRKLDRQGSTALHFACHYPLMR
mmetsp:Transcript_22812/g.42403  ORF Transcript_22812/g.42403 Transcript_22812/m.42403 type:complete len:197 (-) Transcript_22812:108-698(-)|eukprot:CAMPEP_0178765254 /NCGR_PEP_ID=MMETSP0744-20121128/18321_1 /TAXON_ID=913974 /ORGANISM="Nitzschia punctata, Strain CCMP561" /LENGTH=196 /DNA_ID=CAMNT_0020420673 /DNA_START=82 /DNA_END=672 /DNA_ORIENTATION=-